MNRRQLTDSRKNSAAWTHRDFGVGPANGSNVQTVSVPAVPLVDKRQPVQPMRPCRH